MIQMSEFDFVDMSDGYVGICLACGAERGNCEPDAREYECEECGEFKVYAVEELLMMGELEIVT